MKIVARLMFNFQTGLSFWPVASFIMLTISAYPVLRTFIPLSLPWMLVVFPVVGVSGAAVFGAVLNRFGFQRHLLAEINSHNTMLKEAAKK